MYPFLTSKSYVCCSMGIFPAQMGNSQSVVGKKDGSKYLVMTDRSTTNAFDFTCTKYVQLIALIAALVAACLLAAALASVIAIAVASGAVGLLSNMLYCGFFASGIRSPWLPPKQNVFLGPLSLQAVSAKATMTCGMGGTILYLPFVTSWWQALLVGVNNSFLSILGCIMAGAAALAFATLSAVAGFVELLKVAAANFTTGAIMSWGTGGLVVRSLLGGSEVIQDTYVLRRGRPMSETFHAGFVIEGGYIHSLKKIATGQGTEVDGMAVLASFTPMHNSSEPPIRQPHTADQLPNEDIASQDRSLKPTDKPETFSNNDGIGNDSLEGINQRLRENKDKLSRLESTLENPELSVDEKLKLRQELRDTEEKLKDLSAKIENPSVQSMKILLSNKSSFLYGIIFNIRKIAAEINSLQQALHESDPTNQSRSAIAEEISKLESSEANDPFLSQSEPMSEEGRRRIEVLKRALAGTQSFTDPEVQNTLGKLIDDHKKSKAELEKLLEPDQNLTPNDIANIEQQADAYKKRIEEIKQQLANPTLDDTQRRELQNEINSLRAQIYADDLRAYESNYDLFDVPPDAIPDPNLVRSKSNGDLTASSPNNPYANVKTVALCKRALQGIIDRAQKAKQDYREAKAEINKALNAENFDPDVIDDLELRMNDAAKRIQAERDNVGLLDNSLVEQPFTRLELERLDGMLREALQKIEGD